MNKKINISKHLNTLTNNYLGISKIFIFIMFSLLIVFIFPKTSKFKYEYQKSKPWAYEDLIAPFDFAILKTSKEIELEKFDIIKKNKPYFVEDIKTKDIVKQNFLKDLNSSALMKDSQHKKETIEEVNKIIDSIYSKGIIQLPKNFSEKSLNEVYLVNNNIAHTKLIHDFLSIANAKSFIDNLKFKNIKNASYVKKLIIQNLIQNIVLDSIATKNGFNSLMNNISITKGMIQNGERIISKGELITNDKYIMLESLKTSFEKQIGETNFNFYAIFFGQLILVFTTMLMFSLFLYFYQKSIFYDNKKIVFILLIIYLMILITNTVIKYNIDYMYIIPVLFVPILIRAFFDSQIALIVHVVMLTIIGLLVPNSFQFVFLYLELLLLLAC